MKCLLQWLALQLMLSCSLAPCRARRLYGPVRDYGPYFESLFPANTRNILFLYMYKKKKSGGRDTTTLITIGITKLMLMCGKRHAYSYEYIWEHSWSENRLLRSCSFTASGETCGAFCLDSSSSGCLPHHSRRRRHCRLLSRSSGMRVT